MDVFYKYLQTLLGSKTAIAITPSTFADIVKQLEEPIVKKEKTPLQVFNDAYYKESMSKLEVEMLKMEPNKQFTGYYVWLDRGIKFSDWVPCVIRPEIEYCCYGKN
jgi:hypothetical protein